MIIQSVILKDMPIPPSANALWTPIKKGKMVRSAQYNVYERMVIHWANFNQTSLNMARILTTKLQPGQAIHIERTYYFPREQVLTKETKKTKSRPKRNDTSNRIKAADDAISALIGIDDCYFWDGTHKKVAIDSEIGFMDVTLTIIDIAGF
jgi:Holliday junction resolvase RusA-like endonuclease